MEQLAKLYDYRFSAEALKQKAAIWQVLCERFFQKYVKPDDVVLDLACGYGEFSRFINAKSKLAVDLNPEVRQYLPENVRLESTSADDLGFLSDASVDVCFTSNFFEHLPDKAVLDAVLCEVFRVLRPGGRFVALQPNIRYLPGAYWDFYDHHLPLTEKSCAEAFAKTGFTVEELIPRFLPYTTKSWLPQSPLLVQLYLMLPIAWPLFGKQFLIVACRPTASE